MSESLIRLSHHFAIELTYKIEGSEKLKRMVIKKEANIASVSTMNFKSSVWL
jgi:hypothetical protein